MNAQQELEKICGPVLACLCDYWQFTSIGNQPSMGQFKQDIEARLAEASKEAAADPALARLYGRIERPLVFFIDYMVKEGNFPFRTEWRELARKYNELSGDEKFFNLLSEALDNPDAEGTLSLFYLMLGLGFDGDRHGDQGYIDRCMRRCEEKFSSSFDIRHEPLVSFPAQKRPAPPERRRPGIRFVLVLAALFMLIGFSVNLSGFLKSTAAYRQALSAAVKDAAPLSKAIFYTMPPEEDNPDLTPALTIPPPAAAPDAAPVEEEP
jgi:hypothetical protein